MKAVLQRVRRASVEVQGELVGNIEQGLVILLGIARGDTMLLAHSLAEKIQCLRIFSDAAGRMNQSLQDVNGSVLVISQFTLLANTRRGRRPSFESAASPDEARMLYESFIQHLRSLNLHVETGIFGATMVVSLENDGPVTLVLDTSEEKEVH
ncbi:MAG: D-aminoacyl-tRNA deacylase [Nitrospirales bacterium]|nr:D-tyrosyl-tRNA(Tyr) deacylase [Nitrospira sp.]MDR4501233.1 D-aminoacyl-tRNA deacylase [Nitrospirales bacterium]